MTTTPAAVRVGLQHIGSRGGPAKEVALITALSLLPAALYLHFMHEPLFGDEAVYATMAQGILDGRVPYRDLFDNKPPVLYAWYIASFLLFGEEAYAPRLLAAAALAGTAALVHGQARLLFSRELAYGATAAFGACSALVIFTANATSEIFMVLPMTASLLAFTVAVRGGKMRWMLVAGALGGIAMMTKQVAVWNAAALGLFAIMWGLRASGTLRQRLTPALLFAAGAAATSSLVLLPIVVTGAFHDFLDATVTFPIQQREESPLPDAIRHFAIVALAKFPLYAGPVAVAAAFGSFVLAKRRSWPGDQLLLFWTAGSVLGVISPRFFFPHYFVQLFPAMALLIALAPRALRSRPRTAFRPAANLAIVATWGVTLGTAVALNAPAYMTFDSADQHIERGLRGSRVSRENLSEDIARLVAEQTRPGDTIYVHGPEASIYFYADRAPGARYFYITPIRVRRDRGVFRDLVADLRASRPAYIVDTYVRTDDPDLSLRAITELAIYLHPPEFNELLAEQYEFVGRLIFVDLYRLRDQPFR